MPPINPYPNTPIYSPSINLSKSFWKHKPVIISLVVVIILIILIVLLIVLQQSKTQQSIAKQFVGDVLLDKTTKSYKLTAAEFQSSTPETVWNSDVQTIDSECKGKVTVSSDLQKSKTAQEKFSISQPGYGTCKISLSLANISGNWQVTSIVSNS